MYSLTGSYTGSGRIDIKTTDETYLDKKSFIEDFGVVISWKSWKSASVSYDISVRAVCTL